MPFRGHTFGAIEPFVWIGAGIGARWLYGVLFDAPLPIVVGSLRGK